MYVKFTGIFFEPGECLFDVMLFSFQYHLARSLAGSMNVRTILFKHFSFRLIESNTRGISS